VNLLELPKAVGDSRAHARRLTVEPYPIPWSRSASAVEAERKARRKATSHAYYLKHKAKWAKVYGPRRKAKIAREARRKA
jgi:hypothetical protein